MKLWWITEEAENYYAASPLNVICMMSYELLQLNAQRLYLMKIAVQGSFGLHWQLVQILKKKLSNQ